MTTTTTLPLTHQARAMLAALQRTGGVLMSDVEQRLRATQAAQGTQGTQGTQAALDCDAVHGHTIDRRAVHGHTVDCDTLDRHAQHGGAEHGDTEVIFACLWRCASNSAVRGCSTATPSTAVPSTASPSMATPRYCNPRAGASDVGLRLIRRDALQPPCRCYRDVLACEGWTVCIQPDAGADSIALR